MPDPTRPTVYVDDRLGSDSNDGTRERPFKTIARAIEESRARNIGEMRVFQGQYQEPIVVRDGVRLTASGDFEIGGSATLGA